MIILHVCWEVWLNTEFIQIENTFKKSQNKNKNYPKNNGS